MSFEEEWAQAKQNAQQQMVHTTLASATGSNKGGSSGTPQGDLKVSQKDLAAVGDEAYKLHERLSKDGNHARHSTSEAVKSIKGDFELSSALHHVASRWSTQLKTLLDACANISNHLDYTKHAHKGDEEYLATKFSKISELDRGFSESTQHPKG